MEVEELTSPDAAYPRVLDRTGRHAGIRGACADLLLGLSAETSVQARLLVDDHGWVREVASSTITTGPLPEDLPVPTLVEWNRGLAEDNDWFLVSLQAGEDGADGPYYVEIINRDAEVVWYHPVPDDQASTFNGVALDGTHLWFDTNRRFGAENGNPSVIRMTLDGRYQVRAFLPDYRLGIDERSDGSWLYAGVTGSTFGLRRLDPDGTVVPLWDCATFFRTFGASPGFGSGAAVRELSGETVVWEVEWAPILDTGVRFVGHAEPIGDLYALNVGPG